MAKYKDILLVEAGDGSPVLITAQSHTVQPGQLVAYDGSKYGVVQKRGFLGDDADLLAVFEAIAPVYELEEAFSSCWKREETDDVSGAS